MKKKKKKKKITSASQTLSFVFTPSFEASLVLTVFPPLCKSGDVCCQVVSKATCGAAVSVMTDWKLDGCPGAWRGETGDQETGSLPSRECSCMDQRTAPDGGLGTATGVQGNAEPSLKNGLLPIKCLWSSLAGSVDRVLRLSWQAFTYKLDIWEDLWRII